jgi:hypothetical protein
MQYYEFVHNLGPLESVDHRTFQADKGFSQPVCDFMLALALVHGDIMNLFLAHTLLVEARPQQPLKETPPRGSLGRRGVARPSHSGHCHS